MKSKLLTSYATKGDEIYTTEGDEIETPADLFKSGGESTSEE